MVTLVAVLLIAVVQVTSSSLTSVPVVRTSSGDVKGVQQNVLEKTVHAYLGIPYATPPVGDLRFRKPVAVEPWNGTYDATKLPHTCTQYLQPEQVEFHAGADMSEDCLYLNIWVPQSTECHHSTRTPKKPIMVWIYGGGFAIGSIAMDIYDGGVLAAYGDVIVASMNYRLGALGFLSVDSDEAPGNMGLLDQLLALQWIKNNAIAFGGDPEEITLFGESAGSVSCGLHLLSPLSSGLFKRVIMQSGSPVYPNVGPSPNENTKAEALVQTVGCARDNQTLKSDLQEVMACLRKEDPLKLAKASQEIPGITFNQRFEDGYFLPLTPVDAFRKGQMNPADVLAGVTSREISFYPPQVIPEVYNTTSRPNITKGEARNHILRLVAGAFNQTYDPATPTAVADFYLNGIAEDEDYEAVLQAVIDTISDPFLVCPTVYFSEAYAKSNNSVYMYLFDYYHSRPNYARWMSMAHFEDVQFVFGLPLRNSSSYTDEERELSRSVMDRWTGFAKTGTPQVSKDEPWPRYTIQDHLYQELKPPLYAVRRNGPHLTGCDFWRMFVK